MAISLVGVGVWWVLIVVVVWSIWINLNYIGPNHNFNPFQLLLTHVCFILAFHTYIKKSENVLLVQRINQHLLSRTEY